MFSIGHYYWCLLSFGTVIHLWKFGLLACWATNVSAVISMNSSWQNCIHLWGQRYLMLKNMARRLGRLNLANRNEPLRLPPLPVQPCITWLTTSCSVCGGYSSRLMTWSPLHFSQVMFNWLKPSCWQASQRYIVHFLQINRYANCTHDL